MSDFGPGYITAIVRFTEFWLKVDQAPEETKILCNAVERIRRDHDAARQERDSRDGILDKDPEIKDWIDGILEDTQDALHSVGKLLEKFRIDVETGQKIGLSHRLEWVLAKRDEFLTKSSLLTTCHQSLSSAILTMRMMDIQERQSSAVPPEYTKIGVGLPISVTQKGASALIPGDRISWAHEGTDNKNMNSGVISTKLDGTGFASLCHDTCQTDIEHSPCFEDETLSDVCVPAGVHKVDRNGRSSHQERRRRRHVYFAKMESEPLPSSLSTPLSNAGQKRSARRAIFFRDG